MANVTRNSYDPTKQRTRLIFQRGRDVADAELNELQDILRGFSSQQNIQSGEEGVYSTSHLLVVADGSSNDAIVRAGSFFIEGARYVLPADDTLAGLGLTPTTAGSNRYDAVRVSFSEIEISGVDDPTIVYEGLGETTRRYVLQAEWIYDEDVNPAEEIAAQSDSPVPTIFAGNTRVETIAYIRRVAAQAAINPGDVYDARRFPKSVLLAQQADINNLTTLAANQVMGTVRSVGGAKYLRSKGTWVAVGTRGSGSNVQGAWRSDDHGEIWTLEISSGSAGTGLHSIAGNADDSLLFAVGYATTGLANVAYSTDYGDTWTQLAPAAIDAYRLLKVIFDGTNWYAVGNNPANEPVIVRITDPTDVGSYTVVHTETTLTGTTTLRTMTDIIFTGDEYVAVGGRGYVYRSTDGTTFTADSTSVGTTSTNPLAAIAHDGQGTIRAVQGDPTSGVATFSIWESTDGGVTWQRILLNTNPISGSVGYVFPVESSSLTYLSFSRLWVVTGATYSGGVLSRPFAAVMKGTRLNQIPVVTPENGAYRLAFDEQAGGLFLLNRATAADIEGYSAYVYRTPMRGVSFRLE